MAPSPEAGTTPMHNLTIIATNNTATLGSSEISNNNKTTPSSSDNTQPESETPKSSPSSPPPNQSPPPPKESPPPSSPPSSSPPPFSPPPSSSPPPSPSPPPSSPPPNKESPPPSPSHSPPPPLSSSTVTTPASPPPPPPESSASPPLPASPPPPNTPNSTPAVPTGVFSPPPRITDPEHTPPAKQSPSLPSSSSYSHKSPSDSSTSSSTSSHSDSNAAIIAGIAAGGVLILALVIICLLCLMRKKRQPYYMDPMHGPPPPGIRAEYYHGTQQWNSPQDLIVKVPPPPGVMGTPAGGVPGWGAPPPAPHHVPNTSSEYSSGFSAVHQQTPLGPPSPNVNLGFSKSQFTYDELSAATGGFSQTNLLGQGGFGYVHKGMLPNGQEVAVKSLKSGSGQGEREFQAEVEIISRVHHRHLVSLVGYCIANEQRMLVYEFVPNKTLEFHLYGKGRPVMDWGTRLRIAVGSAKGLAYLHEDCHPKIIHRDIKAANILLDNNYEAMVADFGLAKLSSDNITHVSTRVMGTFGYLAPEYASSGKLTEKSDVFSFGVMLLELITGRRTLDLTSKVMEDTLVDWARPLMTKAMEDGNYDELVDPRLEGNYVHQEMARMVASAAASIRHSARRRPKMSQIVRTLDGDSSLDDLNEGGAKAAGGNTQAYDTGAYNADMMKFRKMVMNSEEFPSSEYGVTSEYGLNPSSSSSSDSR